VSDAETLSALSEAAEWLRDVLADGPLDAKDVFRQARENGISERTLKRAKRPAGTVGTVGPLGTQGKRAKGANEANDSNGHVELASDEQERLIARMEAS
jgi:hypothetical protein